jgi:hypothetical protein
MMMRLGSGNTPARRRWDVLAVVGLLGWLVFDLTARPVFGSVPWPQSVVDFRLLYDASQYVADTHEYPAHWPYPYPPPAAAIHAATAALPFGVSAALWLALSGLAAGASYFALARTLDLNRQPGLLVVLPLAHVVVAYYFQWDMRSVNCNLLVLAAVLFGCRALAGDRERSAGFWFAASVALKVFPVLVLPYLAWTGRRRALAWAAAFSVAFWLLLPLVAFGGGFADVFEGWAGELMRATDPVRKQLHPILISLGKAADHVAGGNPVVARATVSGVCALWIALGLFGAVVSRTKRPHDGASILAHVSLLVLGPVAVNPYLEPYHLVPLVVPAVLLLVVAADGARRVRVRVFAVIGFLFGLAILKASSPWPLRGLLVNAQALVLCGTAVWATRARVPEARPANEPTARAERPRFVALLWSVARRAAGLVTRLIRLPLATPRRVGASSARPVRPTRPRPHLARSASPPVSGSRTSSRRLRA